MSMVVADVVRTPPGRPRPRTHTREARSPDARAVGVEDHVRLGPVVPVVRGGVGTVHSDRGAGRGSERPRRPRDYPKRQGASPPSW